MDGHHVITVQLRISKVALDRTAAIESASAVCVVRVADWVRVAQNKAIVKCPEDTGRLRSMHRIRVTQSSRSIRGVVRNGTKYAAAVHDGRRAITITPKRKKYLRFEVNGETVFAKRVRQPARKPRPWLKDAGAEASSELGWTWKESSGKEPADET